jgi:hypothetical protein
LEDWRGRRDAEFGPANHNNLSTLQAAIFAQTSGKVN